jgi:hypothetical protein
MNGPKGLEHYNTPSRKGLRGTNTHAYWAQSYVTKKVECCEYCPWAIFKTLLFLPNL